MLLMVMVPATTGVRTDEKIISKATLVLPVIRYAVSDIFALSILRVYAKCIRYPSKRYILEVLGSSSIPVWYSATAVAVAVIETTTSTTMLCYDRVRSPGNTRICGVWCISTSLLTLSSTFARVCTKTFQ